jgi:tRNA1Val (adenine37-N6)-methyltransferase
MRADECLDSFLDGRMKLIQPRSGYRFSIDAVLLSQFATTKKGDILVDMGTGCGVIPLLMLLTRPLQYALGLELQASLADLAARNAVLNGFGEKMAVVLGDIRHPPLSRNIADMVLCNPPYRKKDSGRINPDPQRAIARHEIMISLTDILSAAGMILKPGGRLAMIYPAFRLTHVLCEMREYNLEPKKMQVVYPGLSTEAKLVLVEASLGGRGGLKILPPIIDQGDFSIAR